MTAVYHSYSPNIQPVARPMPRQAAPMFSCHEHQNKERAYIEALQAAGYHLTDPGRRGLKFALFDLDNGHNGVGHNLIIKRLYQRGVPTFLYPHAARPMVQYDGLLDPWPHSRCMFTIAEGGAEIMRRIGFPLPVEVSGWTFCEILPFQPVDQVKNILFGPIHPNANGWLSPVDKELNRKTHARLVDYCCESGAQLTVRHVHDIRLGGINPVPGVTYLQARADGSTAQIDKADLVVGHQTFAYLAVARGKPTLMMGENVPPRIGNSEANFQYVKHWEAYADYLMYPLDILAGDTAAQIVAASKRNAKVTAWRKRFIGEPFDGPRFVQVLEGYL